MRHLATSILAVLIAAGLSFVLIPPRCSAETVAPVEPSSHLTADQLQNLVICARRALPTLSPDEMVAVAVSIKAAEADIAEMRKPKPVTVPAPHSATAAAVKP